MTNTAKHYMYENLRADHLKMIGPITKKEEEIIRATTRAWMNDSKNSAHRFSTIVEYFPNANKILDMASGCGTFVYYGLINGYDVDGVEPEQWKRIFNKMKAEEQGYPTSWHEKIIDAFGEDLPYPDQVFDVVSSYQTIEHVNCVDSCIAEIIRVTKVGGGFHIMCPDYRSTFEGHYLLPWFPLFPRPLAKLYLRALGKKTEFLDTLKYTTTRSLKRTIEKVAKKEGIEIKFVDVKKKKVLRGLEKRNVSYLIPAYPAYQFYMYLTKLFRSEIQTNLVVYRLS